MWRSVDFYGLQSMLVPPNSSHFLYQVNWELTTASPPRRRRRNGGSILPQFNAGLRCRNTIATTSTNRWRTNCSSRLRRFAPQAPLSALSHSLWEIQTNRFRSQRNSTSLSSLSLYIYTHYKMKHNSRAFLR